MWFGKFLDPLIASGTIYMQISLRLLPTQKRQKKTKRVLKPPGRFSKSQRQETGMEEKRTINHFTHEHPLELLKLKAGKTESCRVCFELASDMIYLCEEETCFHTICLYCAKIPQEIMHPFHPHNSLLCCSRRRFASCSVCGFQNLEYVYGCSECSFCLDVRCAAFTPANQYPEYPQLLLIKHQSPLIYCDKPDEFVNDGFSYHCCCKFIENGGVFVCLQGKYLIHESCALLKKEIRHPEHPEHNLTLVLSPTSEVYPTCNSCYRSCSLVCYECSPCTFMRHICCAALVLFTTKELNLDHHGCLQIEPVGQSHPHPLIKCEKNSKPRCFGCGLEFADCIYLCPQCCIWLHKSCADLPRKIVHALHPQHSLTFYENLSKLYDTYYCGGCFLGLGTYVYLCLECDFFLDIRCAVAEFPILIRSKAHQHPLVLFDTKETRKFGCSICHFICNNYFFRCMLCNFIIHDHCHPFLPQTIKHDCHCDPLIFTTSQIKDVSDDEEENPEVYCHACEETRNLADPTYHCGECNFIAHVHCVLSEILPCLDLEKENAALASGFDDFKLELSEETSVKGAAAIVPVKEVKRTGANRVHELSEELATIEKEIDGISTEIDELNTKIHEIRAKTVELDMRRYQLRMKRRHVLSVLELQTLINQGN